MASLKIRIPSECDEEEKVFRFWGKRRSDSEEEEALPEPQELAQRRHLVEEGALTELQGIGIRRYGYTELHRATRGFSDARLIKEGGSGAVYKGVLEGQQVVAVKVTARWRSSDARGECIAAIKIMSEMRHKNVVQLLGWCYEAGRMALVFEFVPNGSLDDYLLPKRRRPSPLSWETRYWNIARGLAEALLYLQEGLDQKRLVVHGDIKPSHILLDNDLDPKLADFGIARVAPLLHEELEGCSPPARAAGTVGYLDPHYAATGRLSEASDVYAFGVVALQLATGRRELVDDVDGERKHLLEWVEELYDRGRIMEAVDPKIDDGYDGLVLERLLMVGLWCTQYEPEARPSVKLILQYLNFKAPMPPNFVSRVAIAEYRDGTPGGGA